MENATGKLFSETNGNLLGTKWQWSGILCQASSLK